MVGLAFCLKNLGPWWGPMNAICHYVNVDGVLVPLASDGDTPTLHVVIKFFELSALRSGESSKT